MWFWNDADMAKSKVYHGQIVMALPDDHYLVRFDESDLLPFGVHEVVHLGRIRDECWSLFVTEQELRKALEQEA
jgi:hypothetical protein